MAVRFETLPAGVMPIKDYPSLSATLVECEHAEEHRRVFLASDLATPDVTFEHVLCGICKGDADTTDDFLKPVKMLAVVPEANTLF